MSPKTTATAGTADRPEWRACRTNTQKENIGSYIAEKRRGMWAAETEPCEKPA